MTLYRIGWKSEKDEISFEFEGETASEDSLRYLVSELEWAAGDYPSDDPVGKEIWERAYKAQLFGRTTDQEFEVAGVTYWRKKLG